MPEALNDLIPNPAGLSCAKTSISLTSTIDRLRQIAAESGDHLLLGDGPPRPDFELLGVCGDLLHAMKQQKSAREARWHTNEVNYLNGTIQRLMAKARKLRATTPAGVYAKVLVIRASGSGAPQLALSLANDLVEVPTLRAGIWPDERADVEALS